MLPTGLAKPRQRVCACLVHEWAVLLTTLERIDPPAFAATIAAVQGGARRRGVKAPLCSPARDGQNGPFKKQDLPAGGMDGRRTE